MDFSQLEIQVGPGIVLFRTTHEELWPAWLKPSFLQAVKDNEVVLFMKGTPDEPMVIALISVGFL
jgi:hypothetical protein